VLSVGIEDLAQLSKDSTGDLRESPDAAEVMKRRLTELFFADKVKFSRYFNIQCLSH